MKKATTKTDAENSVTNPIGSVNHPVQLSAGSDESAHTAEHGKLSPDFIIDGQEHVSEKELHAHDHGAVSLEQSHHAEQQLKTQQQAQNSREVFPKGLAQEHGKGSN